MKAERDRREGANVELKVPVGTIVYDETTGERVHEFPQADERIVVARGGKGAGQRAVRYVHPPGTPRAHAGHPGEERALRLELKLLADVGLVGYPNAGRAR